MIKKIKAFFASAGMMIWVVLAAIGGVIVMLFSAKRKGVKIGKAKGKAEVKLEQVDKLAAKAVTAIDKAKAVAKHPKASKAAKESAKKAAQERTAELGDALLEATLGGGGKRRGRHRKPGKASRSREGAK